MNNELKWLEDKYETISSNSVKIEEELYHSVISNFSYKKTSNGKLYNIKPFEIQRAGFKIGRELKNIPKITKNTYVYYFDKEDKVLLIEIYGQNENIIDREYYFYTEDKFESIHFNSGSMKIVRNIDLSVLKDGHIIEVSNYGRVGSSISNYIYKNNILTEN